jgi:hypothetical protein
MGRLWSSRYYSSVICSQSYLWASVRYVEFNPVRAGIAERPDDYHWSSARDRMTDQVNPIICDPDGLVTSVVQPGETFDVTKEELKEIRIKTRRGVPMGIPDSNALLSVEEIELYLKSPGQTGLYLIP